MQTSGKAISLVAACYMIAKQVLNGLLGGFDVGMLVVTVAFACACCTGYGI